MQKIEGVSMKSFNLALIQLDVTESKEKNLEKVESLLSRAAESGADAAVLPEMFICPYVTAKFNEYAEPQDGPSVERLSAVAAKTGLYLIAGSVPESDGGRIYNTSYSFASDGRIIGKHRKIHLFDVDIKDGIKFKESDALSPGEQLTILETPWGKIGVAICFDVRFAELFRTMALEGVHTVVVPAVFNMTTGPAHWEITFRMRAVDNQVYMAGCAPARNRKIGYTAYANSIITDPWGRVLGKLETDEGILMQEINPEYAFAIREQLPILKGVKRDGYRQ